MMRACATGLLAFAAFVVAGCGGSASCKPGTVLLTVNLPTIPPAGSVLSMTIAGGGLEIQGTATLDAVLKGPLELDLPSYPQDQTVGISASIADLSGFIEVLLTGSCTTASMTLEVTPVDLSFTPGDFASRGDIGILVDMPGPPPRDMAEAPSD